MNGMNFINTGSIKNKLCVKYKFNNFLLDSTKNYEKELKVYLLSYIIYYI